MVGEVLRREREKQGLSIADVAEETSIRNVYLEAIEQGNYDALPGDVYAKGFIRNYSKFLQIDGDQLIREYDAERNIVKEVQPIDAVQAEPEPAPKRSLWKKSAPAVQPSNPEPAKQSTNLFASGDDYRNRLEREKKSGSRMFLMFLGVVVVFLGAVYIAFMDDGSDKPAKPTVKQEQTVEKKAEPAKKYDGVEIKAKFLENCWISVSIDGKAEFEGTIEKGKEMTWNGKESVKLRAGNAGGVEITYNGQAQGVLGKAGQIAEKTFNKESDGTVAPVAEEPAEEAPAPKAKSSSKRSAPVVEEQPAEEPAPAAESQPASEAPAAEATSETAGND